MTNLGVSNNALIRNQQIQIGQNSTKIDLNTEHIHQLQAQLRNNEAEQQKLKENQEENYRQQAEVNLEQKEVNRNNASRICGLERDVKHLNLLLTAEKEGRARSRLPSSSSGKELYILVLRGIDIPIVSYNIFPCF